jgi:hypothetical protein
VSWLAYERYRGHGIPNDDDGIGTILAMLCVHIADDQIVAQAPWLTAGMLPALKHSARCPRGVKLRDHLSRLMHYTDKEREERKIYGLPPCDVPMSFVRRRRQDCKQKEDNARRKRVRDETKMFKHTRMRDAALMFFVLKGKWMSVSQLMAKARSHSAFLTQDGQPMSHSALRSSVHYTLRTLHANGAIKKDKRSGKFGNKQECWVRAIAAEKWLTERRKKMLKTILRVA